MRFPTIPTLVATTILGISTFVLAACSQTDSAISKVSNSQQLDRICRSAPQVHLAFVALAAVTNVKQDILDKENTAYSIVLNVCQNRPQNVEEALQEVIKAYQTILETQKVIVDAKPKPQT